MKTTSKNLQDECNPIFVALSVQKWHRNETKRYKFKIGKKVLITSLSLLQEDQVQIDFLEVLNVLYSD